MAGAKNQGSFKAALIFFVICVAAIAVFKSCRSSDKVAEKKLDGRDLEYAAQDAVRRALKDPESAAFRNVRFTGNAVCGEVNSKNGFGGMSGYQRFINAGPSTTIFEEQNPDFAQAWNKLC